MTDTADILDRISAMKATGERFALATVVRTVAATAAKAGAKAVILADGTISEGWIGGGCARAAVPPSIGQLGNIDSSLAVTESEGLGGMAT